MLDSEIKKERDDLFDVIEMLIDESIRQLLLKHYHGLTQEHQLTAKIAQVIENALDQFKSSHFTIDVAVRDFPDKGPGTLESIIGADLYISVVLLDDHGEVSKGMLVQSKWDDTTKGDQLLNQLFKMKQHSQWSYVWAYHEDKVVCIKTDDYLMGRLKSQSVGKQIANGLRCTEGDLGIGRDLSRDTVVSLREIMQQMGAKHGLGVTVKQNDWKPKARRKPTSSR